MNQSDVTANEVKAVGAPIVAAVGSASSSRSSVHTLRVIAVLGYGLMCFLCLALIAHLRQNRFDALKGNSSAARRVVLPAFEPLLWILSITTGLFTVALFVMLVADVFTSGMPKIVSELFYCGRQFVFLLVMVFMHQKSVSIPALRRCVVISLLLSTYTLPFAIYTASWGDPTQADLYYIIALAIRLLLVLGYVFVLFRPPSRATKRTIREFCVFTFVYQGLSITASELSYNGLFYSGYILTNAAVLWAGLCPLVIWRVLRADTEHWRGMGQRACALQNVSRHRNRVNEHVSSQGLHVLIEMHRKLIIDFAYLELKYKIGVGASAIVYSGVLHSRTAVAAKVYMPSVLTDEVVVGFSQEAALCGALHHPNVVTFHGMCVYPPTICLVFELCQGSLDSVVLANERFKMQQNRQTASVNVGYMIDAARAVAYLHSFSPGFLHRDIKPANFLVDSDHNVKLTDFGESRTLAARTARSGVSSSHTANHDNGDRFARGVIDPSPRVLEMREAALKMTVKGTVEYMAPELINGRGGFACYGEAADVYSLAMTMWDILHPGDERYPGCTNNHLHVFQAVLDGKRPDFAPDVHAALQELIRSAWQLDPRLRPSAQTIVGILETIQEEICATSIATCFDDLGNDNVALLVSDDDEQTSSSGGCRVVQPTANLPVGPLTGFEIVEHLRTKQYVAGVNEALRMGRMWLDAGFLHHLKHAQGFTDNEERFFLDEDYIRLCQPLAGVCDGDHDDRMVFDPSRSQGPRSKSSLGERNHAALLSVPTARRGSNKGRGPVSETIASTVVARVALCACRKHGQRQIHDVKPTKRQCFRRKKVQTLAETDVLTTSLLDGTPSHSIESGFTDFDWVSSGTFKAIQEK